MGENRDGRQGFSDNKRREGERDDARKSGGSCHGVRRGGDGGHEGSGGNENPRRAGDARRGGDRGNQGPGGRGNSSGRMHGVEQEPGDGTSGSRSGGAKPGEPLTYAEWKAQQKKKSAGQ